MTRQRDLSTAFVELADTLVSDYDVADLLYRLLEHCVRLIGVTEAGLLLSDPRGGLTVMASTSERTRLLELFQLQNDQGPCLDCYHSGETVAVADLTGTVESWPRFAPAALAEGYLAVHALPMRLRDNVIGAMNLFSTQAGDLSDEDAHLARALADVATIGILQERAIQRGESIVEQLEGALNSRIIIEQAKGVLAERGGLDMDQAFRQLRMHARSHNVRLSEIAHHVVTGELDAQTVLAGGPSAPTVV
jgi:GAF domain-containing protein